MPRVAPHKCEMCPRKVSEVEKPGNFYIKIMNQSKDNMTNGEQPTYLYFCSWGCLENFCDQES